MNTNPTTDVDRIPLAHSVRYVVRGLPEVPNMYGDGVLIPSEITLTYRAAPDSQLGRVHAYVAGRIWVDGKELPLLPGGLYGQHYDDGLDGWPEWLAEEVRLHDPAVSVSSPPDQTENAALWDELHRRDCETDQPHAALPDQTLRDRIAEALAAADGWKWAPDFKATSPTWHGYQERADAVLAVLPPPAAPVAPMSEREADLRALYDDKWPAGSVHFLLGVIDQLRAARPNTPPSRPEPRLPDHTVNEAEAPAPVPRAVRPLDIEHDELMARAASEHQARTDAEETRKTADRAAAASWAADCAEGVAEKLRAHHEFERSNGALDVITELRRLAAEAPQPEEEAELVCVDECGNCDACGMEPFGTPAEGWREAARFLRRTPRDSTDFSGALRGARLIEDELRRRAEAPQPDTAAPAAAGPGRAADTQDDEEGRA